MQTKKTYYASDVLSSTSQSVSKPVTTITKLTEGTITGAIIGTVGGVMFGIYNHKNVYLSGFVGMLIGGVVSKVIVM